MKAYTTEQIRTLDRIAIEEYGVPGVVLMENAGRGAAEVALRMLNGSKGPVLICCGSGNNGGDGFVVARHLHNAGVDVEIILTSPREKVDPEGDAYVNMTICEKMGLPICVAPEVEDARATDLSPYALVVDALLGTGLSGEVREPARTWIERINASGVPVLAIDAPSGLHTDTGEILGVATRAAHTATFAAAKKGFTEGKGPEHVGELHVIDIGNPREILDRL